MKAGVQRNKVVSFLFGFWGIFFAAILQNTNYLLSGKARIIQGCILVVITAAFVISRAFRGRKLSKTKLDIFIGLLLVAVLFSFLNSPDLRLSVDSVLDILTHFLCLYLLFELFSGEFDRDAFLWGCLATVGLFLFQALAETYLRYLIWFDAIGSTSVWPPFMYRFTSMLEHANKMMLVANMMVYFAVWQFLTDSKRMNKIFAAAYLFVFLLCYPFSSSRNALLNLAVGSLVFVLMNLHRLHLKDRYLKMNKKRRALIIILAVVFVISGIVGGFAYLQVIMNHPSHGGITNPFAGRTGIWKAALVSWKSSQWTGIGPGRLPFGYMAGMSFPPGWLAPHAHSGIVSTLVEFGYPGLIAMLAFSAALIVLIIKIYPRIPAEKQGIASALIAGIASFYVYNLLDDSFIQPETLTFLFLILIAWLFSAGEGVGEWPKISIAVLLIPLVGILAFRIWSNWAYQPAFEAAFIEPEGNWTEIAEMYTVSYERDPGLYFYVSQSGYAWANVYEETGVMDARERALEFFRQSIAMEPTLALNYANLAVLIYPTDPETAIDLMKEAILRAPEEVSLPINLGWFYEDQKDFENAEICYARALGINPKLSAHPFWSETDFRTGFIMSWESLILDEGQSAEPNWKKAQTALDARDFAQTKIFLESAHWVGESRILVALVEMDYYRAIGEPEESALIWEEISKMLEQPYIRLNNPAMNAVNRYFDWMAIDLDVVPGYILLYEDIQLLQQP